MTYTIKELSKKFGLPASTIRYYEQIGLLEDVKHVSPYRREYNESHVDRLNAIECFKKALLSLEDIKMFFTYEKDMSANSEKIMEMLKSHEIKTEESLEALQAGISHLQKKIRYYTLVNDAVKNKKVLPKWEEV